MKTLILSASAAAVALYLAGPVPAAAQSDSPRPSANRCEWQAQPQYGPRAPLRAPVCKKAGDERAQWTGIGGPECDPAYTGKTARWVWRTPPTYGPRAPVRAPVRVWVEPC